MTPTQALTQVVESVLAHYKHARYDKKTARQIDAVLHVAVSQWAHVKAAHRFTVLLTVSSRGARASVFIPRGHSDFARELESLGVVLSKVRYTNLTHGPDLSRLVSGRSRVSRLSSPAGHARSGACSARGMGASRCYLYRSGPGCSSMPVPALAGVG